MNIPRVIEPTSMTINGHKIEALSNNMPELIQRQGKLRGVETLGNVTGSIEMNIDEENIQKMKDMFLLHQCSDWVNEYVREDGIKRPFYNYHENLELN